MAEKTGNNKSMHYNNNSSIDWVKQLNKRWEAAEGRGLDQEYVIVA